MKRQKGKQFSVFSRLHFEILKWRYNTETDKRNRHFHYHNFGV